jgi:hypothetical protein
MAIHTVGHKALGVVHVRRRLPGVVGVPNLVACGAKLRRGGPNHSVIGQAEKRKGQDNAYNDQDDRLDEVFHIFLLIS